ncbi:MAG: hypothetical protein JO110_07635 [Acetobacteraceae bacterium]|nr:hypothetical protein [Acetobacteraceae bacterium]
MTERLSPAERALLALARDAEPSPIPTQVISNGEFLPAPQGELQKRFAARLRKRADIQAKRHGMARRSFLRTAIRDGRGVPGDERRLRLDIKVSEARLPIPSLATSMRASSPTSSSSTATRIF